MSKKLGAKRLDRLDIQGFDTVHEDVLAQVGPWLRLAFGLCATLAVVGTALASQPVLLALAGIAFVAALSPVHPFDLIYNQERISCGSICRRNHGTTTRELPGLVVEDCLAGILAW